MRLSGTLHRAVIEQLDFRRLLAGVGSSYQAPADPRATLDLVAGWRFLKGDAAGIYAANYNDSNLPQVNLPHTWNAQDGQDGGKNYYRGVGWYRRSFTVPASFKGDSIRLRFDGASIATTVYLDGKQIGAHNGAFATFDFDVTKQLTGGGSHVLSIKVDNSASLGNSVAPISGDFTIFGGLYRGVSLIGTNPQHVATNDMASPGVKFSSPTVSKTSANVSISTGVTNDGGSSRSVIVQSILTDDDGQIVAQASTTRTLKAGETANVSQSATVDNPHLWNGRADPYLHNLYVEVRDASTNVLLDLVTQHVGIRSYTVSATQGFLLNGKPYRINGVNLHQDRLGKGWAISDNDIREDVGLIMEIGATGLRTSHYQHSQLLYDLADEKGLIVYAEIPNVGSSNKGNIPTGGTYAASAQQQLKEMIRQNFNHPSIVMWGLYNEVNDDAFNTSFVKTLNTIAKNEDPTRKTVGATKNYGIGNLEKSTDVLGENQYWGWYDDTVDMLGPSLDKWHAQSPATPIGMSEYGAGGSIKHHEQNPKKPVYDGEWHPEEYQSLLHEQTWKVLEARPWLWGTFVWNMFDFASDARDEGDAAGRNDKGLVTYDRKTKKDVFYFYQANWADTSVMHINSARWTDRTSAQTQIRLYSNAANPTATLNGVDVGPLTNLGDNVWLSPTVTLVPGTNTIVASGERNGQTISDSVTWTLKSGPQTPPPTPPSNALAVSKFDYSIAKNSATVEFTTAINAASLSAKDLVLWQTGNASVSALSMTYDAQTRTAVFKFPSLAPGTYFGKILPSGVVDPAGKKIVEFTSQSFTIDPASPPTNPPSNPPSNPPPSPVVFRVKQFDFATNHATVEFSKAINAASLSAKDLVLKSEDGTLSISAISMMFDATANRAVFTFGPLATGAYLATMTPSSVLDLQGSKLEAFSEAFDVIA